jgi:glutamate--cysteine ligase
MKDGFSGATATADDWITHVNSMFPEVRLKRTLEMRSADNQPADTVCALPAVWKGLLYDDAALTEAEALTSRLTFAESDAARSAIADRALHATLGGREVASWANDVLAIAKKGLARIADRDAEGRDETRHLAALEALVSKGQSPADALLAKLDTSKDLVPQIIHATRL